MRTLKKPASSGPSDYRDGIITIGGSGGMSKTGGKRSRGTGFKNPTDTGISVTNVYAQGDGDWERLSDSSSQKGLAQAAREGLGQGMIRADRTYEVELSERPMTGK